MLPSPEMLKMVNNSVTTELSKLIIRIYYLMVIFFIKSPIGHTIGVSEQCTAKLSKLHNVNSSASDKEFIFGVEKNVNFLPI